MRLNLALVCGVAGSLLLPFASAMAQTPTSAQGASPAPASPAPAATPAPATAPAAQAAPAAPPVIAQVFQDWIYRCQSTSCEVAQQMVVRQGDKVVPVMTMAVSSGGAGKPPIATVLAPLGVQLGQKLSLMVDAKPVPVTLDYAFCDMRGCLAKGALPAPFLALMKTGQQGHVKFTLNDGRNVTLNFALNGVGPALAAMDAGKPPVPAEVAAAPAAAAAVPTPPAH